MKSLIWILPLLFSVSVSLADWPQWRGADGSGHAQSKSLPTKWSESENVKWRTELPGRWSSPVIADGKIWVTAAHEVVASEEATKERLKANTGSQPLTVLDNATFHALCIDLESGKLLRDIALFTVEAPQWIHRFNSYASPTPVVENGRVYCHFGAYGTACVDVESGKVVWTNLELHCMHENGPGGSPVLVGKNLIFHMDGSDVQYIAALDKTTGKMAWKTERSGELHENPQLKKAYGTALMVGGELLSPGANWLYSYDPANGDEKWKLSYETLGFSNVARPVAGDGMVFLSTCFMRPEMLGIKLGAQPEIVWRYKKAVPNSPSPIYVDGLLYFVGDSGGLVTCLEAKTGDLVWSERIASGKYWSAPLYAGGKIYFHSEEGVTTVIEAGREFKIVAENKLDGKLMASAAVSGDDLILRTDKAIYRIKRGKREVIWDWIREHEALVWWLGIGSIITFFGSLIMLPVLVVRMSPDYFMPGRESDLGEEHPVARVLGLVAKNMLGLLLLVVGFVMLFIPGQGVLTMLMGVALMDFPGKRALETSFVRRPKVNRALNWIRRRYGREPLQVP